MAKLEFVSRLFMPFTIVPYCLSNRSEVSNRKTEKCLVEAHSLSALRTRGRNVTVLARGGLIGSGNAHMKPTYQNMRCQEVLLIS